MWVCLHSHRDEDLFIKSLGIVLFYENPCFCLMPLLIHWDLSHTAIFSAIIHYHRCIGLHLANPIYASTEYSEQPAEYSYPFEGPHMHCRAVSYSKNLHKSATLKPKRKKLTKTKKIILCVFFLHFTQTVRASWGKTYNLFWVALLWYSRYLDLYI